MTAYFLPPIFIDLAGGNDVSLTFDLGCEMPPRAVNNPNSDVVILLSLDLVWYSG